MIRLLLFFLVLAAVTMPARADEPPVIPIGLDAYRQWEKWPQQRIGLRTYMRSTYDRKGGNEGADASHFLYQSADDFNVSLDLEGTGLLCFTRYNHWHGSPWHYVVDGVDHIITETSSRDPLHPAPHSIFEPAEAMPNPLTWTWAETKGADLSWLPIGFEKSFQMAYSRTHYGTGYYIYQQVIPGTPISEPIRAWDGKAPPAQDVLKLIREGLSSRVPKGAKFNATLEVPATGSTTWMTLNGASVIGSLELSVPIESAVAFSDVRLRITWDGRREPSVDAPVALFFGAGVLYNRDKREYLVKAFPTQIRFDDRRVHLSCQFPMPFFRSAKLELVGAGTKISGVQTSLSLTRFQGPPNQVGYFHATYRDHPHPEKGRDLLLMDTRETEGGGNWTGSFIGTSLIFSHRANLNTLEGDPRFYFDDSNTPQAQGTGTEEWGGGGDYWGGQNMTLPFAGHPTGARNPKEAKNDLDQIESAYRFLLGDLMPFGKNARITLEHGGTNESTEHYETVTFWYGLPRQSLVKTDTLQLGDASSEKAHDYQSPQASPPYEITSRYEWGVDTLGGREIFPATTDHGRVTRGESAFVVKLEPDNLGVLVRRKLDYQYANQRAEVYVADLDRPQEWKPAGIWYLAGSNACVYSNPRDELGATQHIVQTSNRRFRDDEFLVPVALTRGKSAIRIRLKYTPVGRKLFPGGPEMESAWTEIRYDVYCFIMPQTPKLGG